MLPIHLPVDNSSCHIRQAKFVRDCDGLIFSLLVLWIESTLTSQAQEAQAEGGKQASSRSINFHLVASGRKQISQTEFAPMEAYAWETVERIGDWISNVHYDESDKWGAASEVAFWIIVLVLNFAMVIYAAWNLAKKHTEATGSSVLVEVKPDKTTSSASGDSDLLGGAMRRRSKGRFSSFWKSS